MTVKSLRKQLAAAIAMTLVATVALGSSTYAWFALNQEVTATGMSVEVKSDSTFLLIKQGHADAAAIQASKLTEDTAVTASAQLYPTAHDTLAATAGYSAIEAADTTTDTDMDVWYYKYSYDPETSNTSVTSATYVPVTDFDDYVLLNEFSLTVADGSNDLSGLRVKSCTITPATGGDQAVKVLVAGANGCEEFSGTGGNGTGVVLQTANVTSATASTVKIYVYWDGNDTDVYTNGVADLKNTSVEVVFEGNVVPAP